MYELSPEYDSRASFYGKAQVKIDGDIQTLYSYGTPVAQIDLNTDSVTLFDEWESSQTTLRHVKEFLKQNDFPAENKDQIIKDYIDLESYGLDSEAKDMSQAKENVNESHEDMGKEKEGR